LVLSPYSGSSGTIFWAGAVYVAVETFPASQIFSPSNRLASPTRS
jgi:hypothetical protein